MRQADVRSPCASLTVVLTAINRWVSEGAREGARSLAPGIRHHLFSITSAFNVSRSRYAVGLARVLHYSPAKEGAMKTKTNLKAGLAVHRN
jgi:hypothetical protein